MCVLMRMKFLTLIVLLHVNLFSPINGKFYLEERIIRAGAKSATVTLLYECNNQKDEGSTVTYTIHCKVVTSSRQKRNIYGTVNFYATYHPQLLPFRSLSFGTDRNYGQNDKLPHFTVGFIPELRESPMFLPCGDHTHFQELNAQLLPLQALVSEQVVPLITETFSVVTLLNYAPFTQFWVVEYPYFLEALKTFTPAIANIRKPAEVKAPLTPQNIARIAILFLNKMIDPCAVPVPTYNDYPFKKLDQNLACKIYCQYLKEVKNNFKLRSYWCTSLRNEGKCAGSVCMCTRAFCPILRSLDLPVKMLHCNNDFRLKIERLGLSFLV